MKVLPGIQSARGCTEPAAIALAAALAARAAGGAVSQVRVRCDSSTLKNAQAPGIPGTGGLRGAELAAALGALAGDPSRELEVLGEVGEGDVERARRLIEDGAVRVDLQPLPGKPRLYVEARVEAQVETATRRGRAVLDGAHTRLVALERDGVPVPALPAWASSDQPQLDPSWEGSSFEQVLALADGLDAEDAARLLSALRTNLTACAARWGEGEGALPDLAEAISERGSLARMLGRPVTIATSGYSGNQGLVASIPVWVVARSVGADEARLARALATSHLVGSYVRAFTGVLSPLCNAVHAAGAGAAAACVRLLGGDSSQAELACKLTLATSGGTVCDGAKPACSLKVGLGAAQAIRVAQRVVAGAAHDTRDGIAAATLEGTARNLARIAHPAMAAVDAELLRLSRAKAALAPPRREASQISPDLDQASPT